MTNFSQTLTLSNSKSLLKVIKSNKINI